MINTKCKRCNGNSHVTATLRQWWTPKDCQGVLPSIHNSLRFLGEISSGAEVPLPLRDYFLPRKEKGSKESQCQFCSQHCTELQTQPGHFCYFLPSFPCPLSPKVNGLILHWWCFPAISGTCQALFHPAKRPSSGPEMEKYKPKTTYHASFHKAIH